MESVDQRIAGVAAEQHNQMTVRQLLDLGVSREAIRRRRRSGLLVPAHVGVVSLGRPAETVEERCMAAWLACDHESMIGARHAAALYGVRALTDTDGQEVDVVTPVRCKRPGINAIVRDVPRYHRRLVKGIPVTSPARLVFDLGLVVDRYDQMQVAHELQVQDLVTQEELEALAQEVAGQRGFPVYEEAIGHTSGGISRHWAEIRLAELVVAAALREHERNYSPPGCPFSGDLVWPDILLVVEVDSRKYHRTEFARRRDERKTAWFEARGYIVLRIPAADVRYRSTAVTATIAEAIGHAAATVHERRLAAVA